MLDGVLSLIVSSVLLSCEREKSRSEQRFETVETTSFRDVPDHFVTASHQPRPCKKIADMACFAVGEFDEELEPPR